MQGIIIVYLFSKYSINEENAILIPCIKSRIWSFFPLFHDLFSLYFLSLCSLNQSQNEPPGVTMWRIMYRYILSHERESLADNTVPNDHRPYVSKEREMDDYKISNTSNNYVHKLSVAFRHTELEEYLKFL